MKNYSFTLYISDSRQKPQNCIYTEEVKVSSKEDFKQAVLYDHVAAAYRDNRRSNANFLWSDCLMMDVDNTGSDNPAEWAFPYDVQAAFPGVSFYVCYSRNHMKGKNGNAARPRFHVYFPIRRICDSTQYANLKAQVCEYAGFFDDNAKDSARFFFGVENPQVEYFDGEIFLDEFIEECTD